MKNIAIWIIAMIIVLNVQAQTFPIPTDNVNYKAVTLDNYLYKRHKAYLSSGTIFEIRGDEITTTNKDQTRHFNIEGEWLIDTVYTDDYNYPVKKAQLVDDGGYSTVLIIGYMPEANNYFFIISYNNVDFFYSCNISKYGIPKGYEPMKGHRMFNGDYTDEEVNTFMKQLTLWNVDLFTETIKTTYRVETNQITDDIKEVTYTKINTTN